MRFLPIFILALAMALFVSCVSATQESDYLWTSPNGTTWWNISDGIYANATTPQDFVADVNFYTQIHVNYHYNITDWSVETPNLTWQTRTGSCIDIAILDTAMLTRHGIDAHIVYGLANGKYRHTTVQVKIGANQFFIDHRTIQQYQKTGDGLAPGEYMLKDVMLK
jgi:transglutaminase-like putative cysteine protease